MTTPEVKKVYTNLSEIARVLGISRSSVNKFIAVEGFPEPLRLSSLLGISEGEKKRTRRLYKISDVVSYLQGIGCEVCAEDFGGQSS